VNLPLVEVSALTKIFEVRKGWLRRELVELRAVDGVDLEIFTGETLALVGESGSGKSTFGRCLLRLLEATEGRVEFEGEDLYSLSASRLRERRREFQMVFQDPYGSLNPRMKVGKILAEPLIVHSIVPVYECDDRVGELLEEVGLPRSSAARFPHELSGGQRQRVGIARALAPGPKLLVADEPVGALDVSVRAQILNLLIELRQRLGLTVLFIAHDLAMVEQVSDRVAVFYAGRLVELAPTAKLLRAPQHPYTVGLLAAVPVPDPSVRSRRTLPPGSRPEAISRLAGCAFHPRCPIASEICRTDRPRLRTVEQGHEVACHHPGEVSLDPPGRG
jgi:oligopeptide/dipeptide ABC transporter ATP-binding protein